MKTIVLVGDGMGDRPCPVLQNRTPLQAANIPNMRRIAAAGNLYLADTVPEGLPPGSDVANLGLLGYDAREFYSGRAPIEAAGAGIPLAPEDVAIRCNLVHIADDTMVDYSSGHISNEDALPLIEALQEALGGEGLTFHPGVQYRHLLIWKNGPAKPVTQPPHDILEQNIIPYLPQGNRAGDLQRLMDASKAVLAGHPVNLARKARGEVPVTQIWLWGQGPALQLPTYADLYNMTGTVITAVDLVRGLGVLAGLDTPKVPGATGWIDTNYDGKVAYALDALKTQDFVYVHVEAPDECGHVGDAKLKTEAIEAFDAKVVGPIWREMESRGEPYRLLVTMDHRTPVEIRGHSAEPVPLATLEGPVGPVTEEVPFDEFVRDGKVDLRTFEWIPAWLRGEV
ncbi:MAG: cofactor-independent phosphoglycerate mutase [Verrucomicrobia bacterium]|nr:cofactor-independent phosphoglycerate mutase [Verrucomicrobiota bacterium]MCH8526758.1 cofactor-independent phosphoglycerate mutase [Kiritimatiellia bacterium]